MALLLYGGMWLKGVFLFEREGPNNTHVGEDIQRRDPLPARDKCRQESVPGVHVWLQAGLVHVVKDLTCLRVTAT